MRKLTVKRTKSFVACLYTVKLYIEDISNAEITINGTPCRKLGEIKNGDEKVFEIGDDKTRIYAISDKLSKDLSNDYYEIPEGTDDIFISGKNRFNPMRGNSFMFDGNTSEGALQNRKKRLRTGLITLGIAVVIGFIIGLALLPSPAAAKTFSTSDFDITLTNKFSASYEYSGFDVVFDSKDAAVFVISESMDELGIDGEVSAQEYGNLIMLSNDIDDTELSEKDGLTYFDYTENVDGENYTYVAFVYKDGDTFWLIQFCVSKDDYSKYADTIMSWAGSVKFK